MAGVVQLTLAIDENAADVADALITKTQPDPGAFLRVLARKLLAVAGGARGGKLTARVDSMDPSLINRTDRTVDVTITQASLVADTDKLAIGTTEFTWVASASSLGEVEIGADSAECASNLAAAISAVPYMAGLFTASAANAVCTIAYHGDPLMAPFMKVTETGSGQSVGGTGGFGNLGDAASTVESDVITASLGLA